MKEKRPQQHSLYLALMIVIVAVIVVGSIFHIRSQNPGAVLKMASGQKGGIYIQWATEFEKLIEKQLPNFRIQLRESEGSVENVKLLDEGVAQLALVQNDIPGSSELRTVAPLHFDYLHFLVRKDSGIKGIRDLRGKTLTTGLPGSGSLPVVEALLKYFAIDEEVTILNQSVTGGKDALMKGETEALMLVLGFRSPGVQEIFETSDEIELVKLPPLEAEALNGFVLSYPICKSSLLPPYCYGVAPDGRIPTLAIQTILVAHKSVSPKVIKAITESLFSHRAELIHQHPAAAQMNESFDPSTVSFPVHEGAKQYFSRDEPGFIIRYAEMMAFLLSLAVAGYGLFRVTLKWVSQIQKDRIDVYYLEAVDLLRKLESETEMGRDELDRIENSVMDMRSVAIQQLADEKLIPDSSFRILQHLLEQCDSRIRVLRNLTD